MLNDPVFNFLSQFLLVPAILLGLYIIVEIYGYLKRTSGALAANVALPLLAVSVIACSIGLLFAMAPNEHLSLNSANIYGAVYALAIYFLMRKGASKTPKKSVEKGTWLGAFLETAKGAVNGIETTIRNFPLKRNNVNGRRRLYENQSYELMEFLEMRITPKNYKDIIKSGSISFKVETESVPPYEIKLKISANYAKGFEGDLSYAAFFSDILDSIIDLYKNNSIKA